jgi:Ca2+-binding RTX toxin-like protein
VLNGDAGTDSMTGGDGDDTYYVERSTDRVIETGSTGHDIIYSSTSSFTLGALLEDLTLTGTKGSKGFGNVLDNIMTGNAGNNFLSGNDGADILNGNDGADTLNGGDGADQLDGGTGADRLVGGDGNDIYFVDDVADVVVENLGKGSDLVRATVSYTLLANIEVLDLTGGESINGTGNAMNNKVIGNSGENVLKGLVGSDTLDGGDGNDILIGGFGNDILTGGVGADSFVFERTNGSDHITDFTSGDDHVNLAAALVSFLGGTNKLTEASFYAAADAVTGHDADDRLIYNTTIGALYYDVDGIGRKSAVQIAMLDLSDGLAPTLLYSDFTFG